MGRYPEAVATVESALKLAAPNTRDDYNAALAYTHASIAAIADGNRGVAKAGDLAISYQERAKNCSRAPWRRCPTTVAANFARGRHARPGARPFAAPPRFRPPRRRVRPIVPKPS